MTRRRRPSASRCVAVAAVVVVVLVAVVVVLVMPEEANAAKRSRPRGDARRDSFQRHPRHINSKHNKQHNKQHNSKHDAAATKDHRAAEHGRVDAILRRLRNRARRDVAHELWKCLTTSPGDTEACIRHHASLLNMGCGTELSRGMQQATQHQERVERVMRRVLLNHGKSGEEGVQQLFPRLRRYVRLVFYAREMIRVQVSDDKNREQRVVRRVECDDRDPFWLRVGQRPYYNPMNPQQRAEPAPHKQLALRKVVESPPAAQQPVEIHGSPPARAQPPLASNHGAAPTDWLLTRKPGGFARVECDKNGPCHDTGHQAPDDADSTNDLNWVLTRRASGFAHVSCQHGGPCKEQPSEQPSPGHGSHQQQDHDQHRQRSMHNNAALHHDHNQQQSQPAKGDNAAPSSEAEHAETLPWLTEVLMYGFLGAQLALITCFACCTNLFARQPLAQPSQASAAGAQQGATQGDTPNANTNEDGKPSANAKADDAQAVAAAAATSADDTTDDGSGNLSAWRQQQARELAFWQQQHQADVATS